MLKVAVITSTRAEYGLLYPLIKKLLKDEYFECQLVVTGTHLLKRFGNTIDVIRNDRIPIAYEVPIMEEETENINTVIAKGIYEFSKIYEKEQYEAIIVLGDRYELYSFCIPAVMLNIPIIHIHGGERTEGAVDERVRHSISKMASLHFPSLPEYAHRLIQLGENPSYIYSVGALGIDNIKQIIPLSKKELENDLKICLDKPTALMTFHPVTLDSAIEIKRQGRELFEALVETKLNYIVTMPNNDRGNGILTEIIEKYSENYPEKFFYYKSLGQKRYLSLLRYVSMVVGNSSSGLIEVPSFNIPTINVGDRQKGRFMPDTVINCECEKKQILDAVLYAQSDEFRNKVENYVSPYGIGNTAEKMIDIMKKVDFKSDGIIKKEFYDLEFKI